MLEATGLAFATVFVAELGDKSQLLALSLAARYRRSVLIAAITLASALTIGISVLVGTFAGEFIPSELLTAGAGLLFLGFAIITLIGGEDEEHVEWNEGRTRGFVTAVVAISAAELGDKTMLAAVALAATTSSVGVWIGGTFGMAAAGAIGVVIGSAIWQRLSPRTVRFVSAGLFAVVGVVLLIDAWLS